MRGALRHGDSFLLAAPAFCTKVLICISAVFWASPLAAQATRASLGDHGFGYDFHNIVPSVPDERVRLPDSGAQPAASDGDESCFLSPLTGVHSPTTGVASLKVPGLARKDYQHACSASRKSLPKAEADLRKALHEEAQYPAAWLLLGQVLKAQHKPDDARDACSQALSADPNYLPADLCLADLSAVGQRWDEMLRYASAAVALDPANVPQAYFYAAAAHLALHQLADAEKSALKALEVDKTRREPRTHFLLAQIYESEGKPEAEATQLQEYLKSATDPAEVAMVKKYLADLTGNRP